MRDCIDRVSVVILTHNRARELQRTLEHMLTLPHPPQIVVVDNASADATAAMVKARFPQVRLLSLGRNAGAAARNLGVQAVDTEYVAFCDDDTWWQSGALEQAVAILDAHPDVAVLCARILVGPEEREDPACTEMAASPLPGKGLPGPALLGFMAGASVMRRSAFLQAGGYEARFFIGGEEALLTLDLATSGWRMAYVPQLLVHHFPSALRDSGERSKNLVRNALWVAWMRLPLGIACRQTMRILRSDDGKPVMAGLLAALPGLPWVMRKRRVVPPHLVQLYCMLHQ